MPMEDEGGGVSASPPPTVVPVPVISPNPSTGGTVTSGPDTGQPVLSTQPRPIQQAFAEVSSAITIIPAATAPNPGNLPQNAPPGMWFQFQSQPNYVYVMCADNLYRALVLVPVV